LGKDPGEFQIGGIDLREGGRIGVPEEWSLARGVPLLEWKSTALTRARRDFAEFLGTVETDYVQQMNGYLKTGLNVRVPVWTSQAQFGAWVGWLAKATILMRSMCTPTGNIPILAAGAGAARLGKLATRR
jgi:hypothetical protein